MSRPKVLMVTSHVPWPLNSGGHIRSFHLLSALAREFQVELIAGVPAEYQSGFKAFEELGIKTHFVPIPRRSLLSILRGVIDAALQSEPYVLYRRHRHAQIRQTVEGLIRSFHPDVLYLDHLDSLSLVPANDSTPIILDCHNVCAALVKTEAKNHRFPARQYLRYQSRLLEDKERFAANRASAILSVSDQDAACFRQMGSGRVVVVPNGVDCSAYATLPTGRNSQSPLILCTGNMSWLPNARAAKFIAEKTLPELRRKLPSLRVRVVGRDDADYLSSIRHLPNVEVMGTVPSMLPHLSEATVLAVPLTSGGGTRLKILEAFAAGLPVITTPLGCEGLPVEHRKHAWITECENFASGIAELIAHPRQSLEMAKHARQLAISHFDWTLIGEKAVAAVRELHAKSASQMSSNMAQAAQQISSN